MDFFSQSVYASEIAKQCQFAIGAIGQLNHALESLPHSSKNFVEHSNAVFRSIHSFLTHTSNISRLLWPAVPTRGNGESDEDYELRLSSKLAITRARALRATFDLPDKHVLTSRRLRDLLEHFDEKLDDWRRTSVRRNIANDIIGPKNTIAGMEDTDMMRWFDPTTNKFIFRGEEFDIQALATATHQLLPIATKVNEELRKRMISEYNK